MTDAPKKRRGSRSQPLVAGRSDGYVVRTGEGWIVKKTEAGRICGVYPTQAEAERAAKELVRSRGGTLRIQGRDGRWRESFTIGRESFAKISAVEGIRASGELRRDLRDLDRKGFSTDERRRRIANKYGKNSA